MASFGFVGGKQLERILNYRLLVPCIERALANFSQRSETGLVQPVRNKIVVDQHRGYLGVMPVYSEADQCLATKLITVYPDNKHAPAHQGVVILFDHRDGRILQMMDAEEITARRTAAASAVATKHLAVSKPRVLAVLGSGIQARSHIECLRSLFDFEEVRVWSRTSSNASRLAEQSQARACKEAEHAVRDADVICTLTAAQQPIISHRWIKPGAHINAVGSALPSHREIDTDTMLNAAVYVDSRDAAMQEAGDILLAGAPVLAEIGEVILGKHPAHRHRTTVFKSVGIAVEDGATARLVYDILQGNPSSPQGDTNKS